ncbi:hypothetical protein TEA_027873 [Camellia sinensis var. sinensis]|uniref:Uncharacterized protein n=1 Tax=Camellia sinensis var. sinensis TaxID=542762 RepID=A0A4V3WK13_CAMSN|nr:hypothetical protein TEA_027873 [Camellia sinensis var. sinensis]
MELWPFSTQSTRLLRHSLALLHPGGFISSSLVEVVASLFIEYEVWEFDQDHQRWLPVAELALPEDKGDPVYVVAWAPNIGRPYEVIAVATHKGITIWHLGLNPGLDGRLSVGKSTGNIANLARLVPQTNEALVTNYVTWTRQNKSRRQIGLESSDSEHPEEQVAELIVEDSDRSAVEVDEAINSAFEEVGLNYFDPPSTSGREDAFKDFFSNLGDLLGDYSEDMAGENLT